MTFTHKMSITIGMITVGIGIPYYLKQHYTEKGTTPFTTSLATDGKVSVASIINVTTNEELQTLIEQTMTAQPLMIKIMKIRCGACQRMLTPYAIAAGNFNDQITFAEIDYEQFDNQEFLHHTLHLTEVPTFIGYKNGKLVIRFSGVRTQEQLNHALQRLLDSNQSY